MRKSKLIILAWLLLLIPTLLLGVGALRLLQSEEARLLNSSRATASDRIEAIAGNIDLAIAEVQDGLQETLQQLPLQTLANQLYRWKRSNPLVRNVFIWQQGRGLLLPNPEQPASDEEVVFIRRYLLLFANQSSWQNPVPDQPAISVPESASRKILTERRELRQLANQAPIAAESTYSDTSLMASAPSPTTKLVKQTSDKGERFWRSWYADDQLHLLGWTSQQEGKQRYGFEIEMMALLGRLLGNFPQQTSTQESYALLDGNGKVFHQIGSFEISPESTPLATLPLTSLPHWQIAVYLDPNAESPTSGFMLIGSLLIGTFIVAILLGGALLLWQAFRNQRDANQKTSFVSNVSHELKTPLTTIRMYAELLGEGKITDTHKQQRYLQTIIKESQRLTRLVNNVLDFSRLEQGSRHYQHEKLELKQLLTELLETQAHRLREADISLTIELPKNDCWLQSDRDAVQQIVLNLIDNSIKYAASGKQLRLQVEQSNNQYILQLRDWGPGIPSHQKQQIFTKFHRVDNSLTSSQQGSGLGLSIARQFAEGLNGRLEYCSADGGGSCFELILPREGKS